MDKYNYLRKNLPFINPERYIFTNSKNIIKAYAQVDDNTLNLQGEVEMKILFSTYHNQNISQDELKEQKIIRAGTNKDDAWLEIEKILLKEKKIITY